MFHVEPRPELLECSTRNTLTGLSCCRPDPMFHAEHTSPVSKLFLVEHLGTCTEIWHCFHRLIRTMLAANTHNNQYGTCHRGRQPEGWRR